MKIVVIGGSGLIGSKLVDKLREDAHEAVPASPSSGVDTLTGEGLADVQKGASVVVDVSNSPSFEEAVRASRGRSAPRRAVCSWRTTRPRSTVMSSLMFQSQRMPGMDEDSVLANRLCELKEANSRLQLLVWELLLKNQQLRFQRTEE